MAFKFNFSSSCCFRVIFWIWKTWTWFQKSKYLKKSKVLLPFLSLWYHPHTSYRSFHCSLCCYHLVTIPCLASYDTCNNQQSSFLFPTSSPVHSSCFIRVYHFHTLFLQPCTIYPCFSLFTRWWWRRLVYFHSILKFSLIFSPSHSHLQTVYLLCALFSLESLPCWDGHLKVVHTLRPVR